MSEGKKEESSNEENKESEEKKDEQQEEKQDEEKKLEEDESKKDDFEKDSETVPAGKYNQAVRKLREKEAEERELKKQLEASKGTSAKEVSKDEDEFFDEAEKEREEKEKLHISSLVEEKVKPILERLNAKEENDRKKERNIFFKRHPQYLNNAEKWQELLDEMDNSLNPHSKDSHYQQLVKAHRIISVEEDLGIEDKEKEMAAESASKGDGANKVDNSRKSLADERAERLAQNMPIGYEFKK